jgi:enterochelin esterase family protein
MLTRLLTLVAVALTSAHAADDYELGPDSLPREGVPNGVVTKHQFTTSKVYPGTVRDYWVYLPAGHDPARTTTVTVFQDGWWYLNDKGHTRAATVFDNLIHKGEIPPTIGIFINPGAFPPKKEGGKPGKNRSLEYDSMSGEYARFLLEDIFPEVAKTHSLKLTDDPEGRLSVGISSGGICAWTLAWERPDAFRKVISYVGSFTNIRGGHVYPALIRKTDKKPIRAYLQDGTGDLDNAHGNWPLANLQMDAALKFADYDYQFVMGDGGHNGKHGGALFPDMLRWIWRDWPKEEK